MILQRRFAYVGHAVARTLKERYGVSDFCGYVYTRQSAEFLKRQSDISYGTLLIDSEVHERYKTEPLDHDYLAGLERRIGLPSLWPYLAVDRVLMSGQLVREYPHDECRYTHEELLRILQVHAKALERMLDEEKPDFLFCSVIGGVGAMLLFHLCKARGIKIVLLNTGCVLDRWLISETYDSFTGVDDLFTNERERLLRSPAAEEARAFLKAFREKPIPYLKTTTPQMQPVSRKKQFKFLNPKKGWASLTTWLREIHTSLHDPSRHDYDYIGPWNYVRDLMKRKARNLVGANDLYDAFDPNDSFAFFPLQYEPEISLLLQAPYYTDQAHLIRQIAKSLPVQMKLYVKEHPLMAEFRPRTFYKAIKKMPNVKLISPTVSGYEILPHTKLVLTVTGTTAWEGTFLKKPAIVFGHWFYTSLPFLPRCSEIEELPKLIRQQLNDFRYDEETLVAFLAAIFEDSIEVDLYDVWNKPHDPEFQKRMLEPVAERVAKKLNLV